MFSATKSLPTIQWNATVQDNMDQDAPMHTWMIIVNKKKSMEQERAAIASLILP